MKKSYLSPDARLQSLNTADAITGSFTISEEGFGDSVNINDLFS